MDPVTTVVAAFVVTSALKRSPTALVEETMSFGEVPAQVWETKTSHVANYLGPQESLLTVVKPYTSLDDMYVDPLASVELELAEYMALSDGWDGPDSHAPDPAAISAARTLLSHLPGGIPIPKPMLSASGEVGLYWKSNAGFADIVIDKDRTLSLFVKTAGSNPSKQFVEGIHIGEGVRNLLATSLVAFQRT